MLTPYASLETEKPLVNLFVASAIYNAVFNLFYIV